MVSLPIDITGLFPAGAVMAPVAVMIGFVAFILVFKSVLGFIKNMLVVAAASVAFPFVLSYLGYSVPITAGSLVGFVAMGIVVYLIVSFARFFFRR